MTLDDYLASRFGPVFDALNDAGGVPEELMECLKWGSLMQKAKELASKPMQKGVVTAECDGISLQFNVSYGMDIQCRAYYGGEAEKLINPTPDDIFPHLSHLIEQEALT